MSTDVTSFSALLFTGLALIPAAAHVLELSNKIALPQQNYLIVQQLYRGWQFVGVVVVAALISTVALSVATQGDGRSFGAAVIAAGCILATQFVFWRSTFPVNRVTKNWTVLPSGWERLRKQWEYSHATAALLNLVAFISTILAVLWKSGG
jgi:hypothetical protein